MPHFTNDPSPSRLPLSHRGLKSLHWTGGYLLGKPGKPGEGKAKPILTLEGAWEMPVRGIRGAITVDKNEAGEILAATRELLQAISKKK